MSCPFNNSNIKSSCFWYILEQHVILSAAIKVLKIEFHVSAVLANFPRRKVIQIPAVVNKSLALCTGVEYQVQDQLF